MKKFQFTNQILLNIKLKFSCTTKKGGAVNYKHFIQLMTVHLITQLRLPLITILLLTSLSACQQNTTPLSQARHSAVATYDADISDDGKYSLIASVNHDAGLWDLENDVLLYSWSHSKETDIGIIAVDISKKILAWFKHR